MVGLVRGRPGPRRREPSYLAATSLRYQRRSVSGCHDSAELVENVTADGLGFLTEATALRVGPAYAFGPKLFAQGSVFGLKVLDDGLLVAIDPAGEGEDKQVEVEVHRGVRDERRAERRQGSF